MALLREITAREEVQISLTLPPEQASHLLRSRITESRALGGVVSDSSLVLYERGMGVVLPGWGLVFEGSLQRQGSGSVLAGSVRWGHVARFAFAVWSAGIVLVILSIVLAPFAVIQRGRVPVVHVIGVLIFAALMLAGLFALRRWRTATIHRLVTRIHQEIEGDVAAA